MISTRVRCIRRWIRRRHDISFGFMYISSADLVIPIDSVPRKLYIGTTGRLVEAETEPDTEYSCCHNRAQ
jgi:hypothetical protein